VATHRVEQRIRLWRPHEPDRPARSAKTVARPSPERLRPALVSGSIGDQLSRSPLSRCPNPSGEKGFQRRAHENPSRKHFSTTVSAEILGGVSAPDKVLSVRLVRPGLAPIWHHSVNTSRSPWGSGSLRVDTQPVPSFVISGFAIGDVESPVPVRVRADEGADGGNRSS